MRRFAPLAPTPEHFRRDSPEKSTGKKRKPVAVACQTCQRKKIKCDGERPVCGPCQRKKHSCQWDVEDSGVTRQSALKRKYSEVSEEHRQFEELFQLVRSRPAEEASTIFKYVRSSRNALDVLRLTRDAGKLLQSFTIDDEEVRATVERLSHEAMEDSLIKVDDPTQWTDGAGSGFVSVLLSSFYTWDCTFTYPFIDCQRFMTCLLTNDVKGAKYCTQLLANMVCAICSFTSDKVKAVKEQTSIDMGREFYATADVLLRTQNGDASLPTAQALTLMFAFSACRGEDRAGAIHRAGGFEILERLDLERRYTKLRDDDYSERQERRVISKSLWGFFVFESLVSASYNQQSKLGPPDVPRLFLTTQQEVAYDTVEAVASSDDVEGKTFWSSPEARDAFDTSCSLCLILYRVAGYNVSMRSPVGTAADIRQRQVFYDELLQYGDSLPEHLQPEALTSIESSSIRMLHNLVAISILRPLHIDTQLTRPDSTIGALLVHHATADIEVAEAYFRLWSQRSYSNLAIQSFITAAITLVFLLHDASTHEIFTRACSILCWTARDFTLCRFVLHSLEAICYFRQVPVPQEACAYFDIQTDKRGLRDTACTFHVPVDDILRQALEATADQMPSNSGTLALWEPMGIGQSIPINLLLAKWIQATTDYGSSEES